MTALPMRRTDGQWTRISAALLRYWYVLSGSAPRLLELVYWPLLDVLVWGFVSQSLMAPGADGVGLTGAALLGGTLLWFVMQQAQVGVTIGLLEEMWSRNLGNLFATPLRPGEWLSALIIISVIRAFIGAGAAAMIAVPLYGFNLFDLGLPLIAFWINLSLMGWAIGLVGIGVILRLGQGAEMFAWMASFTVMPFAAVFYPVAVLPGWLQPLAWSIPATSVFEGMRAVIFDGTFRLDLLVQALAINVVWLALASAFVAWAFADARNRGTLYQQGE